MGLMRNLYDANFPSPEPIVNKNGNYVTEISGKKAAVVSFLDGSAKKNLNPNDCHMVGIQTAKLHMITKNLTGKRENKLSVDSWRKIYKKVQRDCSKIHLILLDLLRSQKDPVAKTLF